MDETQNVNKLDFLDKVYYEAKNVEQILLIVIYSVVAFFLPFILSHSTQQLIVGSIVNLMIIFSAFHLKKFQAIPLMIMPTIGVIAASQLFGTFTIKLLYMIPFIWIGNFLLFAAIKKLFIDKKMNYVIALPVSIMLKTALLFSVAFIFVSLGLLPALFLTAMGIVQIITALIGGTIAYGLMRARIVSI